MGIRTGQAFLDSLRDGRQIWIDGELIADVTTDRRLAGAAGTMAELYQMQHTHRDTMTYRSPGTGDDVGLSFIQPATMDELIRRRVMVKTWMDATCGMFGRSPDFMNIMLTGLASSHKTFGEGFSDNLLRYYQHVRENDLALTHTLINPQVDRSRPVQQQDKDLAARIVRETDAGIVINGARMISTLCAYANDLMVMPSTYLPNTPDAAQYAFGFSIPVATTGLRFICRPSVMHAQAASVMDFPLSSRLDETDAMVVFDDVLVPWERVFIHRNADMCNGLYVRTGSMRHTMHQFTTKNLAKSEFMMGLGFAIAKSTNIDQHLHVQGMLSELIQFTEFCRSCLRAAEADATPNEQGVMTPAAMPLWTVRMMFPKMFLRMCEIIQTLGAGGLVAVPSYAETASPVWDDVERYFQAANLDSRARIKLFRLAFDVAVSSFSGRQQLYERYYSGDPVRLAATLYSLYDRDSYMQRIWGMLDGLEAGHLPARTFTSPSNPHPPHKPPR